MQTLSHDADGFATDVASRIGQAGADESGCCARGGVTAPAMTIPAAQLGPSRTAGSRSLVRARRAPVGPPARYWGPLVGRGAFQAGVGCWGSVDLGERSW
jgi:hypothetical protein